MKGLNLASFKKVAEDQHTAVMQHKDGHKLVISKGSLPHAQRKQMESLPLHQNLAQGGAVQKYADGTPDAEPAPAPAPAADDSSDDSGDDAVQTSSAAPAPDASSDAGQTTPIFSGDMSVQPTSPNDAQRMPAQVGGAPLSAGGPQTPMKAQMAGFQAEKAANMAGAGAVANEGNKESQAINDTQAQIAALPSQADIIAKNKDTSDKLYNAYANKQIDPDKYWDNHSKVASGIGILLSGIGQAFGAQGGNAALKTIQDGIGREIDRQKNSQEQKMNLWKMNRAALGDDLSANLATQNQLYVGLKYKIDKAAAEAKGQIATANARAANAHIDQAIQANSFKLSLMNPTSDNPDPASRVQFLVPPEKQQKVFDEIDAAKDTIANAPGILQAFDQAAQEVRPMTGGIHTSPTAFIPGMKSAGQGALIARMGPTFKDVEGTVRQAAMDNMEHNVGPQFGDSDERIASRRASLVQYLRSKEAASTAKGFGIDLSRYPSTSSSSIGPRTQAAAKPQTVVQNGHTYTLNAKTGRYE